MKAMCGAVFLVVVMMTGMATAGEDLDARLTALQQARDLTGLVELLESAEPGWLDSPSGLYWRARVTSLQGDQEQAGALLERGLEIDPDHVGLLLMRIDRTGAELSRDGGLSALRRARRLRDEMQRVVDLAPEHAGARSALIQYYLNAPRVAGGGSRHAEPHMEILRQIDLAAWLMLRGQQAWGEGDLEAAADYFARAAEQNPERGGRYMRAMAMQQLERWEEARAELLAVVEREPGHGGAWYQLGRVAAVSETHLQEGLEALQRYLDLPYWPGDPPPAAAWWRVGNLHELGGDQEAARAAYQQALDEDPDFQEAVQALAALD